MTQPQPSSCKQALRSPIAPDGSDGSQRDGRHSHSNAAANKPCAATAHEMAATATAAQPPSPALCRYTVYTILDPHSRHTRAAVQCSACGRALARYQSPQRRPRNCQRRRGPPAQTFSFLLIDKLRPPIVDRIALCRYTISINSSTIDYNSTIDSTVYAFARATGVGLAHAHGARRTETRRLPD